MLTFKIKESGADPSGVVLNCIISISIISKAMKSTGLVLYRD